MRNMFPRPCTGTFGNNNRSYHLNIVRWRLTGWECPNFLDLGSKYMIVVSWHGRPIYLLGDYVDHQFTPDSTPTRLDWVISFMPPTVCGIHSCGKKTMVDVLLGS